MRTVFDENLEDIHEELSKLGQMVNTAIAKSVEALAEHDVDIANEVREGDSAINQMQNKIDQKCYEIIALQQPNTFDLRRVMAVMRAASELERMGDHAENIADVTINVKGTKRDHDLEQQIIEMGEIINQMSHDIIEAFVDFDIERAKATAKEDRLVDRLYNDLRLSALSLMEKDTKYILAAADYSFVGMHLERIGDYIRNIAEWIVYLDTGEITDL
ncbi:MAG: phosphate signaling complex protein PhoU [Atopostipes suicloacalis]|nr:phosphate signaling complex protein PhoU [Atopostipes suicloacalis]MDN6730711.1 phosphate signaling complex protein PhoU [Atopostipes suicloacalis]